jgi:hypothetical protein
MSSIGLPLFQQLCAIGNLIEAWRDRYAPGSDEWLERTELLGMLDATIDLLVDSKGIGVDDADP